MPGAGEDYRVAKTRAIAATMLLTLPIAAPALNPLTDDQRWADAEPLRYRVKAPQRINAISARGLNRADAAAILAVANALSPDARRQPGTMLTIPVSLLARQPLPAKVISFAGFAQFDNGTPLAVGMSLNEGDVVDTGPKSHVRLELEDYHRMMLP